MLVPAALKHEMNGLKPHVQVRDLQVEIAAITSQHASTLDAKRVLEDRQALMTQELNELRARQAETSSSAAARSAPGELDGESRWIKFETSPQS